MADGTAADFGDVGHGALVVVNFHTRPNLLDKGAFEATAVIASGVVKTLDDISTLSYLPNIAGVITSRALFGGAFSFSEARAIATAAHGPTAQLQ